MIDMNPHMRRGMIPPLILMAGLSLLLSAGRAAAAEPLDVVATVPGLGHLVKAVGGEAVDVTVLAEGGQDPHYVEARPSFIKKLNEADLFIQIGLKLESGWVPLLLRNARNGDILPGAEGYLNASTVIDPIGVPTGPISRAQGHLHPLGNPHYLLDPLNGLRVARLIRNRLIELRPSRRELFERRFQKFRKRLGNALFGPKLPDLYDYEKLAVLQWHDKLMPFLKKQGHADLLGGWLGQAAQWSGTPVVGDHNAWNYFFRRFQLDVIGYMEPKPGLPPTTSHMAELVREMRAKDVPLIITSTYFDPRHAQFLARHTQAEAVLLAHQVEAVPQADDYLSMFQYNIQRIEEALSDGD